MRKKVIKDDDSILTLKEIIKIKTRRKCTIHELVDEKIREIIDYIKDKNININVCGERWFDVITQKFYILVYKASEEYVDRVDSTIQSFDTFSDFYKFLNGDIYYDSCFYGYHFSEEEIKKFSLKISKINFDSFISENIDDYTFEILNKQDIEDCKKKIDRAKSMEEWLLKCKLIDSYKELEKMRNEFSRKFGIYFAKNVFFSYLLRTQKDLIKDAYIKFTCKNDSNKAPSFDDVLLNYGRDAAIKVIENYTGECSYATSRKRVRKFKDALECYDNGTYHLNRRISYSKECQMYIVRDEYSNNINAGLITEKYFFSLADLALFVDGNFRGANFTYAPIEESEIKQYQVDENTKYPLEHNCKKYEVEKLFYNGKFIVNQIWLDSKERMIESCSHSFEKFCDFVHFLKGDLSECDLLMCDGIENIKYLKGLNLSNIRVRSQVALALDMKIIEIPKDSFNVKEFEKTTSYELQTLNSFNLLRENDNDYSDYISYISDIHLTHKLKKYKCQTYNDIDYVIESLTNYLSAQASAINLIAGDTSSEFETFKMFMNRIVNKTRGHFFFTLGNHELWDSKFSDKNLNEIVEEYRRFTIENGQQRMHLVHNNIYYLDDIGWNEITTNELCSISRDNLRVKMRGARLIIFGGTGFSGENYEFNADSGLYSEILNREDEICETNIFYGLYEKVTEALRGMNLIVLTHMPMKDWGVDIHAKKGVVYVNGHSHRNYFYDDGNTRIYADNQIGYHGKKINFKTIPIDFGYDWFADYKDGIYEITKHEYEKFYRGIGEYLTFSREYSNLYMLKREGTYMFLMRTPRGSLLILNGGSIKNAGKHEVEYFYENLVKYSTSVSMFLYKYDDFQKMVASEVKRIGGSGRIHGCIIDIDFYNHLYLNPLDGTITPYFAYSMIDKYVYDNIPSLLKHQCPSLYENYKILLTLENESNELIIYNQNLPINNNRTYVESTEMYKISRIIKGLQFTTKYNIVRLWNDYFAMEPSENNGRLILLGIINPNLAPQGIETKEEIKIEKAKVKIEKKRNVILSTEELAKKKFIVYKSKILANTSNVEVLEYINSKTNAKYRCKSCGYEWSTRPDHFKDRQKYKCPKCKN